jgi:hypothetical protein
MHRFRLVVAYVFAATGAAGGVSPDPADLVIPADVQTRARALVERLGSEDFDTREEAQKQLAALGRLALPALVTGLRASPNPEVRSRCEQLLPAATALDVKARLDTFLADTRGEYRHDLPGWDAFRTIACREWSLLGHVVAADRSTLRAARELFARLYASADHRRFLVALAGPRPELAALVVARRQELYDMRYPRGDEPARDPTLDEMLVFLAADSRAGSTQGFGLLRGRRGWGADTYLLSGSGFTAAARGSDDKAGVYRAVAAAWLASRTDPRDMDQAIGIATTLDLNDSACELAARLLTAPGVISRYRSRAASRLVTLGDASHIRLLAHGFESTAVVGTVWGGEEVHEVELRDLALAVSVLLARESPPGFGFADRYPDWPHDADNFTFTRYYFSTPAARKAAFEKWAEWKADSGR